MQSLGTFDNVEADCLARLQGFVALHGDCGIVRKQIASTFIRQNESETLGIVEPLDLTSTHLRPPLTSRACMLRSRCDC